MTATLTNSAVRAGAILVIDDEMHIRLALSGAMSHLCDRFAEAATGAEGIELTRRLEPDLIILDLGLPDMAGSRVCQEIRHISDKPIVVLSARHAESEKIELLTIGADDYV